MAKQRIRIRLKGYDHRIVDESARRKFDAEVYVLRKDEGGRHKPFFSGYKPQFYINTVDVTGTVYLPEGVEMVMPGDNTQMTVELMSPIALEEGHRFAIREGGLTVGAGVITKIIEYLEPGGLWLNNAFAFG